MNNSFTSLIQDEVDLYWKELVKSSNQANRMSLSGSSIRTFLNDHQSLNTISFVIRRHLQKHYPILLSKVSSLSGESYTDLINGKNTDWPDAFNRHLSKELSSLSKKQGIPLTATTWLRYLSNDTSSLKVDTLFRIAFSLHMSVQETQELMLAIGHDNYCMRDYHHVIYFYCQKKPEAYSWKHAEALIRQYETEISSVTSNANTASSGMTYLIYNFVEELIQSPLSDEESDRELIRYMHSNEKEFSRLTLSRRNDFLRLTEYVACLYPNYTSRGKLRKVTIDENGVKLDELVKAISENSGILGSTVTIDVNGNRSFSVRKRRQLSGNDTASVAFEKIPNDDPFMNKIQFFMDRLSQHWSAIRRVYTNPEHAQNVDRRDIILLVYFFLVQYPEIIRYEPEYEDVLNRLQSLTWNNSAIDYFMDNYLYDLYDCVKKEDEESISWNYLPFFNRMLEYFHMPPLYMPCPFDRFLYLSLFSREPDTFIEAVLGNYSSITDEPAASADEELPAALVQKMVEHHPFLLDIRRNISQAIYNPVFAIGRYSEHPKLKANYGIHTSNKSISRRHALILFHEDSFYLADVSRISATTDYNRVLLNGTKLRSNGEDMSFACFADLKYVVPLENGDTITICGEQLLFSCT